MLFRAQSRLPFQFDLESLSLPLESGISRVPRMKLVDVPFPSTVAPSPKNLPPLRQVSRSQKPLVFFFGFLSFPSIADLFQLFPRELAPLFLGLVSLESYTPSD